jgi:hypothetical protein
MTPAELLSTFRNEVADTARPYFWSDEEIIRYMDEAQKRFVHTMGGIPDATSAITTVTYTELQEFIPISPKILKLRSVIRAADGYPVRITNYEEFYDAKSPVFPTNEYGVLAREVVTGISQDAIRVIPVIPIGTDEEEEDPEHVHTTATLRLVVDRLPDDITMQSTALELDSQYHYQLLSGMKALAYGKHDADTFDATKASNYGMEFAKYAQDAKLDRQRREHKYRSIKYGGI